MRTGLISSVIYLVDFLVDFFAALACASACFLIASLKVDIVHLGSLGLLQGLYQGLGGVIHFMTSFFALVQDDIGITSLHIP